MNSKIKKLKAIISLVLMVVMLSVCARSVFAVGYDNLLIAESKLSHELIDIVTDDNEDDIIPIVVFLKSCDKAPVFQALREKYGYDVDAYEDYYRYESEIVPNVKVNDKTVSEMLNGEEYSKNIINLDNKSSPIDIAVRREINDALVKNRNKYLCDYRSEISNVVGKYVDSFVSEVDTYIEEVLLKINNGEFVIVTSKKNNILTIASNPIVNNIDYFEDSKQEVESWHAVSLTESDSINGMGSPSYNSGSGYDASGITIGVIEAGYGKYDATNYNLTDADIEYISLNNGSTPVVASHATRVVSLICGKKVTIGGKTHEGAAKGATVYQTGISYASEMLAMVSIYVEQYNVNVINYSGGIDLGLLYNSNEQMLDNLIILNRLCYVKSAGNLGQGSGNITSCGKAYNIFTVGSLTSKDSLNNALLSPYVSSFSSYAEADYLTNKPDVIAPGKFLYLPVSADEVEPIGSGTSFAAPVVTGIVAQVMQYDSFAIDNPNCAKNHVICGASNNGFNGADYLTNSQYLSDNSGAGLVNAVNTYESTNDNNKYYGAYLASQTPPTQYKTIATLNLHKKDHLRVALTFEKEENIPLSAEYGNNIDLRLVRDNPYSSYCKSSESVNNNVELIDTYIDGTTTYLIQVRLTDSILDPSGNNDLHYWVSWRVY